jgi:hypothetical protein
LKDPKLILQKISVTGKGDRLGTPGAVGFLVFKKSLFHTSSKQSC